MGWLEEYTDERLIHCSLEGNHESFCMLCRRYENSVTRLIRYQVNDLMVQEDIFQETIITAWRNLHALNNPEKFKSWLLQIARNKCRDFYRRQNHIDQPIEIEILEQKINRHGIANKQENPLIEQVLEEMEKISEAEKQLLRYFYF